MKGMRLAAIVATGRVVWPDLAVRLEQAPFVTVSATPGRTRGVGSEFALATDIPFASRERAVFCHPELGFGFIPGGGGLERLSLNTGRARAIEIIVGAYDFDADTAERYGWINRAVAVADLDTFVDAWATRVAQFDRDGIAAATGSQRRPARPPTVRGRFRCRSPPHRAPRRARRSAHAVAERRSALRAAAGTLANPAQTPSTTR
jgi:enoyl-CoA hydratase/carnithine racemase